MTKMRNHSPRKGFHVALAILGLALASTAPAVVVQDFESGIGPNGFIFGDSARIGTYAGIAPFAGAGQLMLTTFGSNASDGGGITGGGNAVLVAALNTSLGLPNGTIQALAPAGSTPITEGSGYSFTLPTTLNVGDVVSFSYNFLTADGLHQDFAFAVLLNTATQATTSILLANALTTPLPGTGGNASSPFNAGTGYLTSAGFTIAAAGNYQISFGVIDANNNQLGSGLLLDNITVTSVPEPSTLALAGLGALGVAGFLRRRKV
jgi:hypothetical protein